MQESILIMESCLGRHSEYHFNFDQVVDNLQKSDTQQEYHAVCNMIQALEEYKKLLNLECRRRKYFVLYEDKERIDKIRISQREKCKKDRILPYTVKKRVEDSRG